MRKICHSFCQISIGKIFLFLYGKSFANSLLFFRYFPPLFYRSAVHILSVLYRILLLFGRSGDGVVVWVLSCCAERFHCGVLFWKTSFLSRTKSCLTIFGMSLWTELYRVQVVNKMLFGIVNGSLFVRRVWTGYGGVCVQLTFGMSVNGRYGREGMRSLLFFFLISFVASFLLDVLYGVRNKSELCVQVFFMR